jgi:hypothetical protein
MVRVDSDIDRQSEARLTSPEKKRKARDFRIAPVVLSLQGGGRHRCIVLAIDAEESWCHFIPKHAFW